MKSKRKKTMLQQFTFNDYFVAFCLAAIIAVIPVIVRMAFIVPTSDELAVRILQAGNQIQTVPDAFTYYKSRALIIFGALILLFQFMCVCIGEKKVSFKSLKEPVFMASMLYIVLAVASGLFSSFKGLVFSGYSERSESIYIVITYMIVFLTVRDFCKSPFHSRLVLHFFLASALLIGVIGLFQTFGLDFFTTNIANRLVLGPKYYGQTSLIPKYKVYSTLYNPNCVGLYTSLLIPVFLLYGIFYNKRMPLKILYLAVSVILIIFSIGAESEAGYIGLAVAAFICLAVGIAYCLRFLDKKVYKQIIISGSVFMVAAAVVSAVVFRDSLSHRIIRLLNIDGQNYDFFMHDVVQDGQNLNFHTQYGMFTIAPDPDGVFSVLASGKEKVEHYSFKEISTGTIYEYGYQITGIGELSLQVISSTTGVCRINGFAILIQKASDNSITVLNTQYQPVDLNKEIPSIGFKGMERFASSRGYIWSRSLPIFFRQIIIGSGPDTYVRMFPQDDIRGKIHSHGEPYIIVDKPHNWYLQVGINTGLVSLAAMLFIFVFYVIDSLKTLLKHKASEMPLFALSLGLLGGICGYLVCSMSSDSAVSVAPLFWAALGLGFGVNRLISGRENI